MASGLIDIMKRAAIDAEEAGQPCDLRTGTVKTVSPLSIQISSQLILPEALLIVPEKLKDYTMEVTLQNLLVIIVTLTMVVVVTVVHIVVQPILLVDIFTRF